MCVCVFASMWVHAYNAIHVSVGAHAHCMLGHKVDVGYLFLSLSTLLTEAESITELEDP